MNLHLSQFLTGHGCFQSYLRRIKKTDSSMCVYCNEGGDTARHTFYVCPRWEEQRCRLANELGVAITPENTVEFMFEGADSWEHVGNYITTVLKQKETDEREAQKLLRHTER